MTTMNSYDTHPNRDSWLKDPLDIMVLLDAIEGDEEVVTLGCDRQFRITHSGYSRLDKTAVIYRIEPVRDGAFVPMGFYSVRELQSRLDKM